MGKLYEKFFIKCLSKNKARQKDSCWFVGSIDNHESSMKALQELLLPSVIIRSKNWLFRFI